MNRMEVVEVDQNQFIQLKHYYCKIMLIYLLIRNNKEVENLKKDYEQLL